MTTFAILLRAIGEFASVLHGDGIARLWLSLAIARLDHFLGDTHIA